MPGGRVIGQDASTGPDWVGRHGRDGYYTTDAAGAVLQSLPAYISAISAPTLGHYTYTLPNGGINFQLAPTGSSRISRRWFLAGAINIDLTATDEVPRLLSVCTPMDGQARIPQVSVRSFGGATLYSNWVGPAAIGNAYNWIHLAYWGSVRIEVNPINGTNRTFQGLFFGPYAGSLAGAAPSNAYGHFAT